MPNRIQKKEFVHRLARRMETDEKVASAWLDAVTDEIYEALRSGESVTLPNFGNFYVRQERSGCVFRFNPAQRLRALFGWSSSYKGEL
jgi:DNA-binding protein HU-beta